MRMPSFSLCLVVRQFQWKNRTCGNSPSRAFTVTPSAGHLPTTAAKELALLQEPFKITSLKIFSLMGIDCWALELQTDRQFPPLEIGNFTIELAILSFKLDSDFELDSFNLV